MMRIQDKTLSSESRLDELNNLIIQLNTNMSDSLLAMDKEIGQVKQEQQDNTSNQEAINIEMAKLEKSTNEKLKVILDEVLKENQRIIKRIRLIEQEIYGEASTSTVSDSNRESGSSIIGDNQLEYVNHKVKTGENLWVIAQQYGTSMEAIAEANNMENISDIIKPGQTLRIPVKK
ncbi:LysM peptidoglycan-binding domain-containing protein [bacterium]|nr:LysM peptidoglycan-binding domain-containing protein [bacterium]